MVFASWMKFQQITGCTTSASCFCTFLHNASCSALLMCLLSVYLAVYEAVFTELDHTTESHASNYRLSTSSTKACCMTQELEVLRPTLDAIIKSVVSAFSCAKVLAMCVPSMLDTNQTFGPPLEYGFRASVTISGPWHTQMWSTLFIQSHIVKKKLHLINSSQYAS